MESNEPKAALDSFFKAHKATSKLSLSKDFTLAASFAQVGNALAINERYEELIRFLSEYIAISRDQPGFDMAFPLSHLAFALWAFGHSTRDIKKLNEAGDVCEEAFSLAEAKGHCIPSIPYTLGNISHSKWPLKSDDADAAMSFTYYNRALTLYDEEDVICTPQVTKVLVKLSDRRFLTGRFGKGRKLLGRVSSIYIKQSEKVYAAEIARIEYKTAKFLQALHLRKEVEKSRAEAKARLSRALADSGHGRMSDEFMEFDFDNAVVI